MKLLILDSFGMSKLIKDPEFIPRIGDSISWKYAPAPRVTNVLINYDEQQITVTLG